MHWLLPALPIVVALFCLRQLRLLCINYRDKWWSMPLFDVGGVVVIVGGCVVTAVVVMLAYR